MVTTNFAETRHAANFILWEEERNYSRDNIVIVSGSNVLLPGTVVGKITQTLAHGTAIVRASPVNTGNATIAFTSAYLLEGAQLGSYTAVCTDATHFSVFDPNGTLVGTAGSGVFGTAWANEVKFTITAGVTPCVAGDGFVIPVTGVSNAGKYKPVVRDATDGTQTAEAVIVYGVDATSADVSVAAITRTAQLNQVLMYYDQHTPNLLDAGMIAQMNTDLAANGIIVRPALTTVTQQ